MIDTYLYNNFNKILNNYSIHKIVDYNYKLLNI